MASTEKETFAKAITLDEHVEHAASHVGRGKMHLGYGVEIDPACAAVTLERLSLLNLKPELVE
jgi:hypothetical protein